MKRHNSTCKTYTNTSENSFDPKCSNDLVVNRTRIKDICEWLDCAIKSNNVRLLLLTGPSGCGKTATVRVLAAEKGVSVMEWITPVDTTEIWEDNSDFAYTKAVNVYTKFKTFLLRVGRYSSVIEEKSKIQKRLIIIKDFPPQVISAPEEFRNLIDMYVACGVAPIVFICSESINKKSKDFSYELFSEAFKEKHRIVHISLLPVPVTSLMKALRRIVHAMNCTASEELMKNIAEESHGDIRKAINDIYIHLVGGNAKKPKYRSISILKDIHSKKLRDDKGGSSKLRKVNENDVTSLFHAVGRVLYAKRDIPNSNRSCIEDEPYFKPDHRGELIHKPIDIVKQYSHYADQFLSIAHSNYLDIFSSVNSIAKAAEYLSSADVIMSEWREKDLLKTVGFAVAVGGFMESNTDPVRKWKPLKGSQWTDDLKTARSSSTDIRDLFSAKSMSTQVMHLEVLPFLVEMYCSKSRGSLGFQKCKQGFLPHSNADMFSALKKIREYYVDMPTTKEIECDATDGMDLSIHISDDSD